MIYSLMWLNEIASGGGNATSRMAGLNRATDEVLSLHQQYAARVERCNRDPHNQEDPLLQTARAQGVHPAGNTLAVDIITNEEAAMAEIAGILSRSGSSHLLWLGNLDPSSSSHHAIAAHATGGRCILFDANLGEFRLRPSEVPLVMREIVAQNSLHFAIPEILLLPMRI